MAVGITEAVWTATIHTSPVLRMHSGLGEKTIAGNAYAGMGELLGISAIKSESGVQGGDFTISLSRIDTGIVRAALQTELTDIRVEIGVSYLADGDLKTLKIREGRISSTRMAADRIEADVYTAMADLTRASTGATYWSDDHQRAFVDEDDACCSRVSIDAEAELEWP